MAEQINRILQLLRRLYFPLSYTFLAAISVRVGLIEGPLSVIVVGFGAVWFGAEIASKIGEVSEEGKKKE
jgi:hypothetical protein